MRNILKIEIKRSLFAKIIIIVSLAGLLVHLYSLYSWDGGFIFMKTHGKGVDHAATVKLLKVSINKYIFWYHGMDTYMMIAPLLACIPYGTSLMVDKKTNFTSYVITRVKRRSFLISKVIANALAGAVIVTIPSVLFYLILTLTTPNTVFKFGVYPIGFMHNIFMKNPEKYILFYMIIQFVFGAVYATFSMAIACFTENKVIITITPFVYWYIGTFVFERVESLRLLSPAAINGFMCRGFVNIYDIIIQAIAIFVISVAIIFLRNREIN